MDEKREEKIIRTKKKNIFLQQRQLLLNWIFFSSFLFSFSFFQRFIFLYVLFLLSCRVVKGDRRREELAGRRKSNQEEISNPTTGKNTLPSEKGRRFYMHACIWARHGSKWPLLIHPRTSVDYFFDFFLRLLLFIVVTYTGRRRRCEFFLMCCVSRELLLVITWSSWNL